MQDAINDQIQKEIYSAYLYLSMSAYFEGRNLPGAAQWMRVQHDEEMVHALKFFDFVNERGGRVVLKAIQQPTTDFDSAQAVFELALEHEKKVTKSIHDLYALAVKENDYPTQSMLQWFIDEQVEEEKSAGDIVAQFRMIGESGTALYMLDQQLGARQAEGE
jgi:ferritin